MTSFRSALLSVSLVSAIALGACVLNGQPTPPVDLTPDASDNSPVVETPSTDSRGSDAEIRDGGGAVMDAPLDAQGDVLDASSDASDGGG